MRTKPWRELTERFIVPAVIVACGGLWMYHYYHAVSWSAAQQVAVRYAVEHRLTSRQTQGFSAQEHRRWNGVWLEPYFFFETRATGSSEHSSPGQVPPFLEVTVRGATGTVVATDVSPNLEARYPTRGFDHH